MALSPKYSSELLLAQVGLVVWPSCVVHTDSVEYAANHIDGYQIAYRTIGAGQPLILLHGTALSSVVWRGFGYEAALKDRYRLILIDLRGHGRSDKPRTVDEYAMDLMVADVLAVLNALNISSTHLMGYSLGGRVALSLAAHAPHRLRSVVIGGGSSRPQAGVLDELFFPGCVDTLAKDGMTAFLDQWSANRANPIDAATRAAFEVNDAAALAAYMKKSGTEPGIGDANLRAITLPVLLFVGSDDVERLDDTAHVAATIPGADLVVIPGLDHATTLAAGKDVLGIVAPFLDGLDQETATSS